MSDVITAEQALAECEGGYEGPTVAEAEKAIVAGHEATRQAWSKVMELQEQLANAEAHWSKCGADTDKAHVALGAAMHHDRLVIALNKKILVKEESK